MSFHEFFISLGDAFQYIYYSRVIGTIVSVFVLVCLIRIVILIFKGD